MKKTKQNKKIIRDAIRICRTSGSIYASKAIRQCQITAGFRVSGR